MSIHMTYIQSQNFQSIPVQKLKILQVHFCVQRLSKSIFWVLCGPFFAIIQAVINKIKNFLREMFRINGDIYDAKYGNASD